MSRGIRNNNPGNIRHDGIRWKGEIIGTDTSFKTFESMAWGVRAIFHLIRNYRYLHGLDTIEKIIRRWAPENENNTEAYVDIVSQRSLIPKTSVVSATDRDTMIQIVAAMIFVENGKDIPLADINSGWELFIQNCK